MSYARLFKQIACALACALFAHAALARKRDNLPPERWLKGVVWSVIPHAETNLGPGVQDVYVILVDPENGNPTHQCEGWAVFSRATTQGKTHVWLKPGVRFEAFVAQHGDVYDWGESDHDELIVRYLDPKGRWHTERHMAEMMNGGGYAGAAIIDNNGGQFDSLNPTDSQCKAVALGR
jgi:hypothetical protein